MDVVVSSSLVAAMGLQTFCSTLNESSSQTKTLLSFASMSLCHGRCYSSKLDLPLHMSKLTWQVVNSYMFTKPS